MLKYFHLAAVIKIKEADGEKTELRWIKIDANLQGSLSEEWQDQYEKFVENTEEIKFNLGYTPSRNQRFCIPNYSLPKWLINQNSRNANNLDSIEKDNIKNIRGLVGFAKNDKDAEVLLFQNFNSAHIIEPGRFLFLQDDIFITPKNNGLTLDQKVSAIYSKSKLLFQSFHIVNTFLPLVEYYKDASDKEVARIFNQSFSPEDIDTSLQEVSQWSRKRFAMLKDSRILEEYGADHIAERAEKYDVDIRTKGKKIIFPKNKTQAKKILQFLNEEIFRGAITEELYETNSKRKAADNVSNKS